MNSLVRYMVVVVLVGLLSGHTFLPPPGVEMEEMVLEAHVGQLSESIPGGIPVGENSHHGGSHFCHFSNFLAPCIESHGEPYNFVYAPYWNLSTSLIPDPYYLIEDTPD